MTDTIVSEVDISMDCFFVYSIRTFSRLTCIYHYFIWSDYKNDKSWNLRCCKECSFSVPPRSRATTDWYVAHSSPMDDPASVFVWEKWNSSLIKRVQPLISIRNFYLFHTATYEMIYKIQVEHKSAYWRVRLLFSRKPGSESTLKIYFFGKTLTSLHNWFDFSNSINSIRGIEFVLQVRSIAV